MYTLLLSIKLITLSKVRIDFKKSHKVNGSARKKELIVDLDESCPTINK